MFWDLYFEGLFNVFIGCYYSLNYFILLLILQIVKIGDINRENKLIVCVTLFFLFLKSLTLIKFDNLYDEISIL